MSDLIAEMQAEARATGRVEMKQLYPQLFEKPRPQAEPKTCLGCGGKHRPAPDGSLPCGH